MICTWSSGIPESILRSKLLHDAKPRLVILSYSTASISPIKCHTLANMSNGNDPSCKEPNTLDVRYIPPKIGSMEFATVTIMEFPTVENVFIQIK